tara:strand:- start:3121 stop:3351 length:231 start_codon:yes stop_codon:yes gene_type:complete
MIRNLLNSSQQYGKLLYYPKYGTSYYDALEYARVLSSAKPDPNEKYDVEAKRWTKPDPAPARGGSEVNTNNPQIKP